MDGVHLDYVRMPDVILPVSLWKNYGIEQKEELPEYDYCYCDVCRELFKAKTGQDPLELKYPMENQELDQFPSGCHHSCGGCHYQSGESRS